jgi:tetratricopeptide (TPR) repeat protein
MAGRYAEAVEQLRKAIALDPSRNRPHNLMARALSLDGKPTEALGAHERSVRLGTPLGATWLACIHARAGRREQALAVVEAVRHSGEGGVALTRAETCLGDAEQALASLERALVANQPGLPGLLQAPELTTLRSTERFAALRKQVNLQP